MLGSTVVWVGRDSDSRLWLFVGAEPWPECEYGRNNNGGILWVIEKAYLTDAVELDYDMFPWLEPGWKVALHTGEVHHGGW